MPEKSQEASLPHPAPLPQPGFLPPRGRFPPRGRLKPQSFFLVSAVFHYLGPSTAGVVVITAIRLTGQPLGFVFAFANCALFVLYIVLGHRIANAEGGLDRLGAAMVIAAVTATPRGLGVAVHQEGQIHQEGNERT